MKFNFKYSTFISNRWSKIPGKHRGTKHAAQIGYKTLIETGNVLDAVEEAVRSMELNADFNAGYGSVLTRFFEQFFHLIEQFNKF